VYVNLDMVTRTSSEITVPTQFFGQSDLSLALSVRIDGFDLLAWLVVGQPFDQGIGSVSVFNLVALNGVISFDTALFTPINGQSDDRFGSSVALVDNETNLVLFVGAPGHSLTGQIVLLVESCSSSFLGSIFVYFLPTPANFDLETPSEWIFVRLLRPSAMFDELKIQRFGFRLSYDKSVLAIGATQEQNNLTTRKS
jgi:hypothetical protein